MDLEPQILRFAKDYTKLEQKEFSTLRLEPKGKTKYSVGKYYQAITPSRRFIVQCTHITAERLKMIQTSFLMTDTDTGSRDDALKELREFYPDLSKNTVLSCIFFKQVLREE